MARSVIVPALAASRQYARGVPGDVEGALQVDGDDVVEVLLAHGDEHAVAQDPGVVHDDVEVAEGRDGLVDDGLRPVERAHAVGVGHRLAAGGRDLVDHGLRRRDVGTRAVHRAAQVVDHDLGPQRREQEGVLTADAPPAPGDDRHSVLQHGSAVLSVRVRTGRQPGGGPGETIATAPRPVKPAPGRPGARRQADTSRRRRSR